ncbi:MAG: hypothetical protein IT379_36015 [Deltaproteobacteria bacterium]|nr:hypothetical protein [Deltaproteobacteria bacterium]
MRTSLAGVSVVMAFAVAFAAVPHHASADAPESERDQADAHFRAGVRALRENDPGTAVAHFHQSQELYPRVTTACNLALAYDRWPGHATEAANAYDRCAEMDEGGSYRQHAIERAAAIRAEQAAQSTPVGDPTHTPIIESPVWGEGATTWTSLPPQGGGVPPQQVDTPGPSATWIVLGVGALAAGGIALGVGIALELDAQSRADALQAQYGYDLPPEEAEELDSIRSQRDLGVGLYVGAAVLGAFGLGSLFVFFSELVSTPDGPTVVSGSVSPDGGRLVLRTRF